MYNMYYNIYVTTAKREAIVRVFSHRNIIMYTHILYIYSLV
jgi:hypothetical protein